MTEQDYILERSGSTLNECSCNTCQDMCKRAPCLGTPDEMLTLIKKGYADRLQRGTWAAGRQYGIPDVDLIVLPKYDEQKGACTFFSEGKCELHDLGLKPLEGRLADCKRTEVKAGQIPPQIMIAYSWDNPRNFMTVMQVEFELMPEIAELLKGIL